ncbi:hypothetical protein SynPROSU1_01018 [Synechococcus sp. PROS-U-1]|nr:hypothetical protein SynPROSU1_01018 [Synechococcus sp. PROS-U-1]
MFRLWVRRSSLFNQLACNSFATTSILLTTQPLLFRLRISQSCCAAVLFRL